MPPLDYVKQTRTAAWLRLGKVAVFSILAGLAIAIGMAFPGDGKDAEAQGVSVRAGYTYTRMICQEWGRQPRWHYVRDPIAGSDWRNDGGWAIILGRGSSLASTITIFIPGSSPDSLTIAQTLGQNITSTHPAG